MLKAKDVFVFKIFKNIFAETMERLSRHSAFIGHDRNHTQVASCTSVVENVFSKTHTDRNSEI